MSVYQTEEALRTEANREYMQNGCKAQDNADSFCPKPLSEQERWALGIAGYYRPYMGISAGEMKISIKHRQAKRLMDCGLGILALIVFVPLMALCMAIIYIEDPKASPVFRQIRIGQNGKPFVMYKLRSMYAGSDKRFDDYRKYNEAQAKAFKMRNDPRITGVGRIMRKLSIDELPQLLNVIKGDMSIVGPRPPLPGEVAQYDEYDLQRLAIRPGLTCYWQIFPRRHEISFEDWVAMDIKYIQHNNMMADISLMLKTVLAIFSGNGD